jgi:hypothetical protein
MSSGIFWLAYSERERQQALDVARALSQSESRDELGVGSVRDALAELLFPGTNTLQTRTRYFLFVPWSFQASARASSPAELRRHVRRTEERLIRALVANSPRREPGIIGRLAGDKLQRMPSSVYWHGLHVWGIRRTVGSEGVIERAMWRARKARIRDDTGEHIGGSELIWSPQLPAVPDEFPDGVDLNLGFDEADFLLQSLSTEPATAGSMLATLAQDKRAATALGAAERAWLYPHLGQLPAEIRSVVEQARRFSLLIKGATLLYNIILSEMDGRAELAEWHREAFDDWAIDAAAAGSRLVDWKLRDLWSIELRTDPPATLGARVPDLTQQFVGKWLRLVQGRPLRRLADNVEARALIVDRERRMKRGNARTANVRALKQWGGDSGTATLDFRWGVARALLNDIHDGLQHPRAVD